MQRLKDAAEWSKVTLAMPKFKKEFQFSGLGGIFTAMGMNISDGKLEKMGIEGENALDGIQKTSIDVDEEGLTLAAVTAITIFGGNGGKPETDKEVTMTVDRPFVYSITDNLTGAILLMGTVTDL